MVIDKNVSPILGLVHRTIENSASYWAGEYHIAQRFFGGKDVFGDPLVQDLWLRFQIHKEWYGSGVYGSRGIDVADIICDAASQLENLDKEKDFDQLGNICDQVQFAVDELRHYVLLGKLYRQINPKGRLHLESAGKISEGEKLTELRYKLRKSELGQTAVTLSEGGGLGLFFGIRDAIGSKEKRSPTENSFLFAVEEILEDEVGHLAGNFQRAQAKHQDPSEWEIIDRLLQNICQQKLLERYEQFGYSVNDEAYDAAINKTNSWKEFLEKNLGFLIVKANGYMA